MSSVNLAFNSESSTATYSLIAIPTQLLSESLEIRGSGNAPAVLVTPTETYSLQGTQHSNSLLLMLNNATETGTIEATLHETLNLVKNYPNFIILASLLLGTEYFGPDSEAEHRIVTMNELKDSLPASDEEIREALLKLRVLEMNGNLRLLSSAYLLQILPQFLQGLVAPHTLVDPIVKEETQTKGKRKRENIQVLPAQELSMRLDRDTVGEWIDAVDIDTLVGVGIMKWFGELDEGGSWNLRIDQIVKEIGVALLASGGHAPQSLSTFLEKWSELTYSFSPLVNLSLLTSTHLLPNSTPQQILFFPLSRLSPDPSTRFTELFAIKPRWEEAQMTEFINDLVGGEKKKREAMVLKFVRKVKEDGRTLWTARNLW